MKALELKVKAKDDDHENKQKLIFKSLKSNFCVINTMTWSNVSQSSYKTFLTRVVPIVRKQHLRLKVSNETMKLKVSTYEIERAHPPGPKQMIVKFMCYKTRFFHINLSHVT